MKKTFTIIVLILIVFFYNYSVNAGNLTVDVHVDGFTTGDSWQINRAGTQLTSTENSISIDDQRGTSAGWIFTISFTDFSASGIDDPSVGSATLSLNVDVEDWLSITLKDSVGTVVAASDIPATTGLDIPAANYSVNNSIVGSGGLDVLTVDSGHGAGLYDFTIDYVLNLDDWLPDGTTITSTSGSGKFPSGSPVTVNNASQKYQIFVGTYSTTITYSVSSNPG